MEAIMKGNARSRDKRTEKTRGAIRKALCRLLSQKDAAKICVSELTETASISRKTFYLHYASVDEAVKELESEIEQRVVQAIRESDVWSGRYDLYGVMSCVDHALREDETYAAFLGNRYSRYFMMYRLKNAIKRTLLEEAQRRGVKTGEVDLDSVTEFAVSGMVSMYYEWLRNKTEPLQQLAEKTGKMLFGGLGSLLGGEKSEKEEE